MSANFVDVMLIDADTASFLLTIFPALAADVAAAAGGRAAAARAVLVARSASRAVAAGRARRGRLPRGARAACRSRCRWTARRRSTAADYVSQFARSGALALFDVATRGLLDSDSAVSRSPVVGRGRPAQPGSGCRTSSSCSTSSSYDISAVRGHQGAARLSEPLPLVRRQGADLPGRRRGRADLVHRVQCAERTFGALLRPLRRVRDADRRRPRHAKPAERAAQLRLSHLQRSIPGSARSSARATSRRRSASITSMTPRTSRRATSSPTSSTTPSPPICSRRDHAKGPMFVFTYLMANHFPWTFRYRDELSADWRDLGNRDVNGHRIDEYLRRQDMSASDYKAFRRAAQARFPGRAVPDRALRRPPADVRQEDRRAGPRRHRHRPPHRRRRSALLHHLLRHRRAQLQTGRPVVGDHAARRRLSAARHAGGRGRAARRLVCRAEAHFPALQRPVLSLRRAAPRRAASTGC